ncbi:MAG: hypothetical protein FIA89_15725 [Geobacter sp.]|nr:hypothetical protein [Geobacter sp.]
MPRLHGNKPLFSRAGQMLASLGAINRLPMAEKEALYGWLLPDRLLELLQADRQTLCNRSGERLVQVIAPEGLSFVRIEVRSRPDAADLVFFAELTDTQFHQMELAFCIICDPAAPRFAVDVTEAGAVNYFTSHGRNLPEELRAMQAGLFPHQTRRGLRMFGEFFERLERFTDRLGMEMIVAEPLSYDNAIRYERYGFDYLTGKRLMLEIDRQFHPGGILHQRLDGSSPFRMPGMERTVRGRSWAIHDGIMDEPWDGVQIYKMIGVNAGLNTFPDRQPEEQT